MTRSHSASATLAKKTAKSEVRHPLVTPHRKLAKNKKKKRKTNMKTTHDEGASMSGGLDDKIDGKRGKQESDRRMARLGSHDRFFLSMLSVVPPKLYFRMTDDEKEQDYEEKQEAKARKARLLKQKKVNEQQPQEEQGQTKAAEEGQGLGLKQRAQAGSGGPELKKKLKKRKRQRQQLEKEIKSDQQRVKQKRKESKRNRYDPNQAQSITQIQRERAVEEELTQLSSFQGLSDSEKDPSSEVGKGDQSKLGSKQAPQQKQRPSLELLRARLRKKIAEQRQKRRAGLLVDGKDGANVSSETLQRGGNEARGMNGANGMKGEMDGTMSKRQQQRKNDRKRKRKEKKEELKRRKRAKKEAKMMIKREKEREKEQEKQKDSGEEKEDVTSSTVIFNRLASLPTTVSTAEKEGSSTHHRGGKKKNLQSLLARAQRNEKRLRELKVCSLFLSLSPFIIISLPLSTHNLIISLSLSLSHTHAPTLPFPLS